MSKMFQTLDKSFFQKPQELGNLVNKGNFVHKYLPKQMDIDKILEIIQRKVLKGTHLPTKPAIRKIESLAEKYVLLDSLLFKISSDKETAVLAVSENMY